MPPGSKVDHVLAVLTLERVLPELDAARKQLEEMKASSEQRIRQLESERDELRAKLQSARSGEPGASDQAEVEGRLRGEFEEARKTAEARIQQLETERDQIRSQSEQALAAQDELKRCIAELESALEARKSAQPAEGGPALQVRVQALEEALQETQSRADQEREEAKARIGGLEAEREKLEAGLAAKEKKLMDALAQIEEVHEQARQLEEELARLRSIEAERDELSTRLTAQTQELLTASQKAERVPELEAELTEWKTRVASPSSDKPTPAPKEAAAPSSLSPSAVTELYQQTMSRLTVIQASAELLSMSSKLDPASRDTAKDIRNESHLLSEIIKKFALPPDLRKAE